MGNTSFEKNLSARISREGCSAARIQIRDYTLDYNPGLPPGIAPTLPPGVTPWITGRFAGVTPGIAVIPKDHEEESHGYPILAKSTTPQVGIPRAEKESMPAELLYASAQLLLQPAGECRCSATQPILAEPPGAGETTRPTGQVSSRRESPESRRDLLRSDD